MILLNGTEFSFSHAGLFTTDKVWTHPVCCQKTYQLIYVTNGEVHIFEDGKYYDLVKGNVLVLSANETHYGYLPSEGTTSFYWVHFKCTDIERLNVPHFLYYFDEGSIFKELLHYHCQPNCLPLLKDTACLYLLAKLTQMADISNDPVPQQTKIAKDIFEWTRINASAKLSVADIAQHFGYSSEHISRIMKKYYKITMKSIIDNFVVSRANDLLSNSNYSSKTIATMLGFENPEAFFKFYKYHQKISPSKFRNKYTQTYMNNK